MNPVYRLLVCIGFLALNKFGLAQNSISISKETVLSPAESITMQCKDCDTIRLCKNWIACGKMVDGKKSGIWKYINAGNGVVEFSGEYVNGLKEGKWDAFSDQIVYHYRNNKLDGEIVFYTQVNTQRIVYERRQYKNGKADGDWITYDETGTKLLYSLHYANGKPTGVWEFHSGDIVSRGPMNENGYHGKWEMLENDTVKGGGEYINGKQEGFWIDYMNRQQISKGFYKNGKRTGTWKFQEFQYRIVSEYKDGLKDGQDTVWFADTLFSIYQYKNGKPCGTGIEYYWNGLPREKRIYDDSLQSGKLISYSENGTLQMTGNFAVNPEYTAMVNCLFHQYSVYFPPEIQLDLIERNITGIPFVYGSEYIDADADSAERYMQSEQYRKDTSYSKVPIGIYPPYELRTGKWTFYHANGKKKEEGQYLPKVEGNADLHEENYFKTGWWMVYNEKGKFIRKERFENGILVETSEKK